MIWELIASLVVACVNAYFAFDKADRLFGFYFQLVLSLFTYDRGLFVFKIHD